MPRKALVRAKRNVLMPRPFPEHPIILRKSNLFNMAAVSAKSSITRVCNRISTVLPVLLTIKTELG